MKKFYLLIAIVMIGNLSNAQFTKGQKLVGPSLAFGFNNNKTENIPNSSTSIEDFQTFSINAGVSSIKMKTTSMGLGVGINYGFTFFKRNYSPGNLINQRENNHAINLSLFKRKFIAIKPKFNFYYDLGATASVGLGDGSGTYISNTPSSYSFKSNEYGIRGYITPGFTYAIKKNLLIDAALNNIVSIGYNHATRKYTYGTGEQKSISSNFNASSTLTAGGLLNNFSFSFKWII